MEGFLACSTKLLAVLALLHPRSSFRSLHTLIFHPTFHLRQIMLFMKFFAIVVTVVFTAVGVVARSVGAIVGTPDINSRSSVLV